MNSYNFEPGEFLLMQETDVALGIPADNESIKEVVLSNTHLILVNEVSRGLFKTDRLVKRCPLSQIKRAQGEPQVPLVKHGDNCCLQVIFESETIPLLFSTSPRRTPSGTRRTAERWAASIRQAANGNLNDIKNADTLPPELADVVDGTKNFFGSLTGKNQKAAPDSRATSPAMVSVRCPGCHAPLTGQSKSVATCPYCGTKHTL